MARGEVDGVVVGADRICANGDVVNKVGTFAHALGAAHAGIPFVVVAPESTVDEATPDGAAVPIEDRGRRRGAGVPGPAHRARGRRRGQSRLRRDPGRAGDRDRHRPAGDPGRPRTAASGRAAVTVRRSAATADTQPPARPRRSSTSTSTGRVVGSLGTGGHAGPRRVRAGRSHGTQRADRIGIVERCPGGTEATRSSASSAARTACRVATAHRGRQRRRAGGHPGTVAERAGAQRQRERIVGGEPGERRGQQVRHVRDGGDRPVVLGRGGRHHPGAQRGDQAGQGQPVGRGRSRPAPGTAPTRSRRTGPGRRPGSRRSPARPSGARRRSRPAGRTGGPVR